MAKVNPILAFALNLALDRLAQKEGPGQQQGPPELIECPAVQALKHKEGAVVLILGRRESGKTVLAERLAEILGRPTFAISPEQKPPPWITELQIEDIAQEPPPWSTLICDDLPVYMSSRDYSDAYVKVLERLIPVVRHTRKLVLLFSSQSSALSDRFALDADLLFLKPASLLYLETERPQVARLFRGVMPIFNKMTDGQRKRHAYLISDSWQGLVRIEKPRS